MEIAVAQESFQGPLGLLLSLIEKRELDITTVSLARVADDFVARMEEERIAPDALADFLLIAARLIYLKSRELMPYLRVQEEEDGADALAEQLRIYKEFAAAAERLEERFLRTPMFLRPAVPRRMMQTFTPPPGVTAATLADVYRTVLRRLEPFFALQEVSMERVRSVEERIEELTSAIAARASVRFTEVTHAAARKIDVVMSFLALLELLRRNVVRVTQQGTWGDIMIHRVE